MKIIGENIFAKDADGKSVDGLIRDGVYITVVLPEGEVGRFFLGSDASNAVVWKEWGVEAWFDSSIQDPNGRNALTNNNTTACFYYADGYADAEADYEEGTDNETALARIREILDEVGII
jgi:hypothetical protein